MSAKQDRQGVRTAAHLEQKYNFGERFGDVAGISTDLRNYVDALGSAIREEYNEVIKNIYGNISRTIEEALEDYVKTGDFEQFQEDLKAALDGLGEDISDAEGALQAFSDELAKGIRLHPEGGVGIGRDCDKANTLQVGWAAEFDKETVFRGNSYCAHNPGTPGVSGFVAAVRIAVTGANADAPITFRLSGRRSEKGMTVHIRFAYEDSVEPDLESVKWEGDNLGAFLYRESESAWVLYVEKADPDDEITVQCWKVSPYMAERIAVTFPEGEQLDELPEDCIAAEPVVSQVIDTVFPVGYTLLQYGADPNELYAGTTWELITEPEEAISAWRRTA